MSFLRDAEAVTISLVSCHLWQTGKQSLLRSACFGNFLFPEGYFCLKTSIFFLVFLAPGETTETIKSSSVL